MDPKWQENGPLVIGGMGGSGTRVVAEICSQFGYYLGDDLNPASDNLLYTLLFRRRSWFYKSLENNRRFQTGLSLLKKLILKKYHLTPAELWFLGYAVVDTTLHYRDDWRWARDRLAALVRNPGFRNPDYRGWGWKEPNTHLLINPLSSFFPRLKFIYTIRHGLDMAFSKNQRQVHYWGNLFGVPQPMTEYDLPAAALSYWVRASRQAAKEGQALGEDQFLIVNFDRLCHQPEVVLQELVSFLEIDPDPKIFNKAVNLPHIPESMGRYQEHSLSQFLEEDLAAVRDFGYPIDRDAGKSGPGKEQNRAGLAEYLKNHPHLRGIIVNPERKFIYMKAAKTAGTSILRGLLEPQAPGTIHQKDHPARFNQWLAGIDDQQLEEYYIFSILRNPWDRMVSLAEYFEIPFLDFVHQFEMFCQTDIIRLHALPIHLYTHNQGQNFTDHLCRFEHLQPDMNLVFDRIGIQRQPLPFMNPSGHPDYRKYYGPEEREIVAGIYAKDIEYFGYVFAGHQAPTSPESQQPPDLS